MMAPRVEDLADIAARGGTIVVSGRDGYRSTDLGYVASCLRHGAVLIIRDPDLYPPSSLAYIEQQRPGQVVIRS